MSSTWLVLSLKFLLANCFLNFKQNSFAHSFRKCIQCHSRKLLGGTYQSSGGATPGHSRANALAEMPASALAVVLAAKVVINTIIIIIIVLLLLDITKCKYQRLPTYLKSSNTSRVANKSRVLNISLGPNLKVLIDVGGCYWRIYGIFLNQGISDVQRVLDARGQRGSWMPRQ